jgi:hypothetical protein
MNILPIHSDFILLTNLSTTGIRLGAIGNVSLSYLALLLATANSQYRFRLHHEN